MSPIPLEVIITIAGIAALVFSAITMNALHKIKSSCTGSPASWNKKEYDAAYNLQIAQLVVSVIVVILAGWVAASTISKKSLPGAASLSAYARRAFA